MMWKFISVRVQVACDWASGPTCNMLMDRSHPTPTSPFPRLELRTWSSLPHQPPFDYTFQSGKRNNTALTDTTAFSTGLEKRDTLKGLRVCVVCAEVRPTLLQNCHIIPPSKAGIVQWELLKHMEYVPASAKDSPVHEPRNGLTLCINHHALFDGFDAFVRYFPPPVNAFVWFEYESYIIVEGKLRTVPPTKFHGRCLRLDANHPRAPIYSLFLLQEMRARGAHALVLNPVETGVNIAEPLEPYTPTWLSPADGGDNNEDGMGGGNNNEANEESADTERTMDHGGGEEQEGWMTGETVLAAAYRSESWRECTKESLSFTGTAEENIALYRDKMPSTSPESLLHPVSLGS
ncbi:hypothetical protein C8F01DRAFT_1163079 [Mycena amicta]|nr:hypothetical protein C8F01DRAFT_1163079 [Mycena amicta]